LFFISALGWKGHAETLSFAIAACSGLEAKNGEHKKKPK
jgi:hypothetical protein